MGQVPQCSAKPWPGTALRTPRNTRLVVRSVCPLVCPLQCTTAPSPPGVPAASCGRLPPSTSSPMGSLSKVRTHTAISPPNHPSSHRIQCGRCGAEHGAVCRPRPVLHRLYVCLCTPPPARPPASRQPGSHPGRPAVACCPPAPCGPISGRRRWRLGGHQQLDWQHVFLRSDGRCVRAPPGTDTRA